MKRGANEMNRIQKMMCLFFLLFVSLVIGAENTKAETIDHPHKTILFVYDSLDVSGSGEKSIESLQRLLTSLNIAVSTVSIDHYQKNQLQEFDGMIELMNAPDLEIQNKEFLADRDDYQGLKLHIGDNLPVSWQEEMGIQLKKIPKQRFKLSSQELEARELILEPAEVTVNATDATTDLGLISFENQQTTYSYGTLKGKIAYLPYFHATGLSQELMVKLLQKWLNITYQSQPVLVITGVTPFSDLALLEYMGDQLFKEGIPFAVSATSVWQNTDLKAYDKYVDTLQYLQFRNGSILLQTPVASQANKQDDSELKEIMNTTIDKLVEHEVYPIGIATPAYWNQDQGYQEDALSLSDSILLLPNPQTIAKRVVAEKSGVYQKVYYALPAENLDGIEWTDTALGYKFSSPTAITYDFPDTLKKLNSMLKKIDNLPMMARDIRKSEHHVATSASVIDVKNGQVRVNGELKHLHTLPQESKKVVQKQATDRGSLAGFFAFQDKVLTIIIVGTLFILVLFFIVGYNLYRGKYRTKK